MGAKANEGRDAAERESSVFRVEDVRFGGDGLLPAVIQSATTGEVLMVGYMNSESLEKTLQTGLTWFYSRSRGRLWQKGESSGHVQRVRHVLTDCDQDTLLVIVDQEGPGACHEGFSSCFHHFVEGSAGTAISAANGRSDSEPIRPRPTFDPAAVYSGEAAGGAGEAAGGPSETAGGADSVAGPLQDAGPLQELYEVIRGRRDHPVEGSYTSYLFGAGVDKILKKVGEESAEVLISGKGRDAKALVMESADLIYHLLVLWVESGVRPEDVWRELGKRRGGGGSEDAAPGK